MKMFNIESGNIVLFSTKRIVTNLFYDQGRENDKTLKGSISIFDSLHVQLWLLSMCIYQFIYIMT